MNTSDCTEESRKDETCLQFKMNKHYIKIRKNLSDDVVVIVSESVQESADDAPLIPERRSKFQEWNSGFSLYSYERAKPFDGKCLQMVYFSVITRLKPFKSHMLAAKWFIFLDFYMRQVYHSYVLFGYILKKTKFSLTEFFIFNYFFLIYLR